MTDLSSYAESLPSRVGIVRDLDDPELTLRFHPYPHACRHGVVRMAVWALMADMAGGWVSELHAADDWTFTTDMTVRFPARPAPAMVKSVSDLLRLGRDTVLTRIVFLDEHDAEVGYAEAGFIRKAMRPTDPPKPSFDRASRTWWHRTPLDAPFEELAGIRVLDAATGQVELDLHDVLRNPAGILQGGITALLGEVAAEVMADHVLGGTNLVTEMDLRYLNMGRIGPIASRAWFIGDPAAGSTRVELYDRGNGDRLIASLLCGTVAV